MCSYKLLYSTVLYCPLTITFMLSLRRLTSGINSGNALTCKKRVRVATSGTKCVHATVCLNIVSFIIFYLNLCFSNLTYSFPCYKKTRCSQDSNPDFFELSCRQRGLCDLIHWFISKSLVTITGQSYDGILFSARTSITFFVFIFRSSGKLANANTPAKVFAPEKNWRRPKMCGKIFLTIFF